MGAVFVKILNMSITAGWIVLAVLLVRLLLKKKAPKALFPILWAMVAVRLVCPVTFETGFSLIRNAAPVEQTEEFLQKETVHTSSGKEALPEDKESAENPEKLPEGVEVVIVETPENREGGTGFFEGLDKTENPGTEGAGTAGNTGSQGAAGTVDGTRKETPFSVTYTETMEDGTEVTVKRTDYSVVIAVIWLCGMAAMLLYTIISYVRIYRKVKESAPLAKHVRICDSIHSPFILGIVRPRIYLPSDIDAADREYVLAHERAHLKRFDHIWKPVGFLLLSVYWFHPLLWVAYVLLCKDIEYACDEKVIKELGVEQKKTYSTALINCSVSRKMISACPLAFGETGVKGRIKSVLHYKKPAFWIIIASVVISGVLAVCFLTNPLRKKDLPKAGDIITFGTYEQDNVLENGREPIEWMVLDVFDGKASLISLYGLDTKPFHEDGKSGVTWSESDLRSWLNGEFYETAFDEKLREQILTTRLETYPSAQYNKVSIKQTHTEDKVYLLSIDELFFAFEADSATRFSEDYFHSKASRARATEYARAQGAWEKEYDDGVFSPWLLRTPGLSSHHISRVDTYGGLSYESYNSYGANLIRPAIRISLADGNYEIVKTDEPEDVQEEVQEETQEEITHSRIGRFVDVVPLDEAKQGYVVNFGQYKTNDSDAAEPYDIEWLVLDVKDGKALLLSKYIMESMPYHEREEAVSWADCTLREWLNGTFYETAFSEEEQARIATTLLENVWNPWNTSAEYDYTEDKVFLPSIEDMLCGSHEYSVINRETTTYRFDGYFQTDMERMARRTKALTEKTEYSAGLSTARYWLRTSSQMSTKYSNYDFYHEVAIIYQDGRFGISDTTISNNGGVRPAIWVEIGDLEETNSKDKTQKTESKKEGTSFKASYLPERYDYKELKEVFLEFLNHQAYLNPNVYPQEKYTCNVDVYCTADSKMKRVYLKTVTNGAELWYLCTPTVYLDEEAPLTVSRMDSDSANALLKKDALAYLGVDSVKVPAVTKPEYHNTDTEINEYKESINYISELLHKNGYTKKNGIIDGIKLELWISAYDMEKKLLPYVYVVINDTFVYETSFSKYEGFYGSFYKDNYSKDYSLKETIGENAYIPEEFNGRSLKPLSATDPKRLERVKECSVLHYVYEEEFSATIIVDGKEVTLPKQNVEDREYCGIAFVPTKTEGNITYYDIYRRGRKNEPWSLVCEDYRTFAGEIAAIVSLVDDYIVCYFERSGDIESRCILSEDGGVTWSQPTQTSKPNAELKDAAIGTTVVFGSYKQDNDWYDGDEALEWIVLDRVGNQVLLLSKYGIFTNTYYENYHEGDSWETSYMRSWLNDRFYVDAFSKEERAMITTNVNKTTLQDTGYVTTEDRVFLLSSEEVMNGKAKDGTPYFQDDSSRMLIPTAREIWNCSTDGNNEFEWWVGLNAEWWLRNHGDERHRVAVVGKDGRISNSTDYHHRYEPAIRPAIWVDISSLEGKGQNATGKENETSSPVVGTLPAQIEQTNISIAIGDEYAAYLDEAGKLHVLYDTSEANELDTVGATGGIELTKTYKALGTDPYRLVAIDEEGRLSVSYYETAEEIKADIEQTLKEVAEAGGNYGTSGKRSSAVARDFETLAGVKQIFSSYPFDDYMALLNDGTVRRCLLEWEELAGVVQVTPITNGVVAGLKEDGTLVMTEVTDVLRKKKLDEWPKKFKQICSVHCFSMGKDCFVGLKQDGTVISEGVEQEYMINTVEQWSGIVKIAAGNETVVGLKSDGTVVAVCPARSDVGQCDVDDWKDVIAVNTNGSVTVGITKDGKVLMAGAVPELIKSLPERYNYEEMKTVFLEYLNHQAWLYPSQYPQEGCTCSYELYCNTNDTKTKYVYLKTVINETEYWYLFKPEKYYVPSSPTRIVLQRTDIMQESLGNSNIVSIGTDEIYVPAVTKLSYGKTMADYVVQNITGVFSDLKANGYGEQLRLEVIISDYDMEKGLFPYAYLIVNDSQVFETTFGEMQGNNIELYPLYQMYYYGNYKRDYTIEYGDGWPEVFDGHGFKPLDTIDAKQLERVKACAIYHKILIDESTTSLLINGETIQSPKSNVTINEETGVGIAFLPQWALAGTVYYNIYRTEDGGTSWKLIAQDITSSEGGIARILIPEKDTVVCYFKISGTTEQSSCIVSEDGGVTWKYATYLSKPNSSISDPKIGTSVIFGAYEQDGDESNGKEPLEWLVLDRDGDKALILSKYGIETMQYDKDQAFEAWEEDALYWMMNRTIYEYAFTAEERAALIQSNPIEDELIHFTNERLLYKGYTYLLETIDVSYGQAQDGMRYFRTDESRITIPTAYAAEKGAWLDENGEFAGVEAPWLLTVTGTTGGDFSEVKFARVMSDGSISYEEDAIKEQYVMIRPAIWVDVTKIPQ